MNSPLRTELPPIMLKRDDSVRLAQLAQAAAEAYPSTSDFLAREVERATIVDDPAAFAGIVGMNSRVHFLDQVTSRERRVTLVYPEHADVDAGRVSVLTPIGAALIGLSAGQAITFETPNGEQRSLRILDVRPPE